MSEARKKRGKETLDGNAETIVEGLLRGTGGEGETTAGIAETKGSLWRLIATAVLAAPNLHDRPTETVRGLAHLHGNVAVLAVGTVLAGVWTTTNAEIVAEVGARNDLVPSNPAARTVPGLARLSGTSVAAMWTATNRNDVASIGTGARMLGRLDGGTRDRKTGTLGGLLMIVEAVLGMVVMRHRTTHEGYSWIFGEEETRRSVGMRYGRRQY
ncbi:hypothetical protein HK104_010065 [Borealophlyctis nickersoniae]|nr:hypothetical protein HK104_010065 [Borealophlyctis nickersoniae]